MRDEVAIITGAASGISNLVPGLATILTRKLTAKGLATMQRMRREREDSVAP